MYINKCLYVFQVQKMDKKMDQTLVLLNMLSRSLQIQAPSTSTGGKTPPHSAGGRTPPPFSIASGKARKRSSHQTPRTNSTCSDPHFDFSEVNDSGADKFASNERELATTTVETPVMFAQELDGDGSVITQGSDKQTSNRADSFNKESRVTDKVVEESDL